MRNRDQNHVLEHEQLAQAINPELEVEEEREVPHGGPFSCPFPGCDRVFEVSYAVKVSQLFLDRAWLFVDSCTQPHYNITHHGSVPPVAVDVILKAAEELPIGVCPCGLYKGRNRHDFKVTMPT